MPLSLGNGRLCSSKSQSIRYTRVNGANLVKMSRQEKKKCACYEELYRTPKSLTAEDRQKMFVVRLPRKLSLAGSTKFLVIGEILVSRG